MKGAHWISVVLTPLLLGGIAACSGEAEPNAAEMPPPASKSHALAKVGQGPHPVVRFDFEGLGTLRIELYPELAPVTVENFLALTKRGDFDNTKFHRVIPGFMIQGGDRNTRKPDPRLYGRAGPGYTIEDEFSDFPHLRGTVSMANRGSPNTASNMFFIVHQDSRQLDGSSTAFGRVIEGMEIVDAVTELEIDKYGRYGPPDRPYPVHAVLAKAVVEGTPELASAGDAADAGLGAGPGTAATPAPAKNAVEEPRLGEG